MKHSPEYLPQHVDMDTGHEGTKIFLEWQLLPHCFSFVVKIAGYSPAHATLYIFMICEKDRYRELPRKAREGDKD